MGDDCDWSSYSSSSSEEELEEEEEEEEANLEELEDKFATLHSKWLTDREAKKRLKEEGEPESPVLKSCQ